MKFDDKMYEKDVNFESLERNINNLNKNLPEVFSDTDENPNDHESKKKFYSDRNHNLNQNAKVKDLRYSQMSQQEAEDTFARRKMQ